MSAKEAIIEWVRQLPENLGPAEILVALRKRLEGEAAKTEPPAGEEDWSAEELTEEEWRNFVAWTLRDELADERQDIYSLEDGEPIREQG